MLTRGRGFESYRPRLTDTEYRNVKTFLLQSNSMDLKAGIVGLLECGLSG